MENEWQPIDTALKHTDLLFFRADQGVCFGQYTTCDEWMTDSEKENFGDDDSVYDLDFWCFDHSGATRMDGDLKPTHWMPLPKEPKEIDNASFQTEI